MTIAVILINWPPPAKIALLGNLFPLMEGVLAAPSFVSKIIPEKEDYINVRTIRMTCKHKRYPAVDGSHTSVSAITLTHTKMKRNRIYLGCLSEPYSPQALSFIDELALRIHRGKSGRKPTEKAKAALGAVLADLMNVARSGTKAHGFRSLKKSGFTGDDVGYRVFWAAIDGLKAARMVERREGAKMASYRVTPGDKASEFFVLQPLLDAAAAHGITPDDWARHFRLKPQPTIIKNAITLRKSRSGSWFDRRDRGEDMPVDWSHPNVIASKHKVDEINAFFSGKEITALRNGDKTYSRCHCGFKRIYNQGDLPGYNYNKGGRLYSIGGGFQNLSKEERATILIDGEETVEIDIRASHLVGLHAVLGCPLDPSVDPYSGLSVDRGIMKMFIMQTVGSDNLPTRWSSTAAESYAWENDGQCLYCDHPFNRIKSAVLSKFPVFKDWASSKIRWGDLQFNEAEVILGTVYQLAREHNIPSLPVHDSLIVRKCDEGLARSVLAKLFEDRFNVPPYLT